MEKGNKRWGKGRSEEGRHNTRWLNREREDENHKK